MVSDRNGTESEIIQVITSAVIFLWKNLRNAISRRSKPDRVDCSGPKHVYLGIEYIIIITHPIGRNQYYKLHYNVIIYIIVGIQHS